MVTTAKPDVGDWAKWSSLVFRGRYKLATVNPVLYSAGMLSKDAERACESKDITFACLKYVYILYSCLPCSMVFPEVFNVCFSDEISPLENTRVYV